METESRVSLSEKSPVTEIESNRDPARFRATTNPTWIEQLSRNLFTPIGPLFYAFGVKSPPLANAGTLFGFCGQFCKTASSRCSIR